MRRRFGPRRWPWLLVVLALLALARLWPRDEGAAPSPSPAPLAAGEHAVERVVDGDTLLLEGGMRVRLIGVDAPESVKPDAPVEPWGPEAADFTRAWIERAGGRVRLQFDRERVDDYGRHLAYVWDGERMLNEELIRAGMARAMLGFPYSESQKRRFRRAEDEARQAQRGVWSAREASMP
jgi:micrococcal nuclease